MFVRALVIFTVLLSICAKDTIAQVKSIDEVSVRLNALYFVENMAKTINIKDEQETDDFLSYFVDENVEVPNWVLTSNKLNEKLKISNYIVDSVKLNLTFEMRALPYSIVLNDENLTVNALLVVNIQSKSYLDTLDVKIEILKTNTVRKYAISNIELNTKRGKYLMLKSNKIEYFKFDQRLVNSSDSIRYKNKFKFVKISEYSNAALVINNKYIESDNSGYYLMKDVEYGAFRISNSDNYLTKNRHGAKKVEKSVFRNIPLELKFREPLIFISISSGFNPFKKLSFINTAESKVTCVNISVSNLDLDLGINIFKNNKFKLTTSLSLNRINYITSLYLNKNVESYLTIDPDIYAYIRENYLYNIKDKITGEILMIGAKLNLHYKLSDKNTVGFLIGYKKVIDNSINTNTKASAIYSGIYPDFFNVKISDNGVYDFGSYNIEYSSKLNANKNVNFLELGFFYEYKLNKRYSIVPSLVYDYTNNILINPVGNSLSKNSSELNSLLIVNYYKYNMQLLSMNIGLKYNL
jgi:hypothetical protein